MKRVLILGGGFGGIAAARTLRAKLAAEDEIILVDQGTHFMVGFRKSWALVGMSTLEEGQRPLDALARLGIRVLNAPITTIDPGNRAAEVGEERLEADALVIALGAALAPESISGFAEHAFNVYERGDIPRAADALRAFKGGRVAVGIFGAPYKCPPAPYEIALMVKENLDARGLNVEVEAFTPLPMSLPILGKAGSDLIESRLADRGINFFSSLKATRVEAGQVVFATGERHTFDMLLGVPPHKCPDVVTQSGLAEAGGWVQVNARTMETRFARVYAVGDVVEIVTPGGKPLPKAGVFAETMGKVAAERIAAVFAGQMPTARFEGEGGCFLEVGRGEAMMVKGRFLAEPAPEVYLTEPSAAYMEDKRLFEAERLKKWFG